MDLQYTRQYVCYRSWRFRCSRRECIGRDKGPFRGSNRRSISRRKILNINWSFWDFDKRTFISIWAFTELNCRGILLASVFKCLIKLDIGQFNWAAIFVELRANGDRFAGRQAHQEVFSGDRFSVSSGKRVFVQLDWVWSFCVRRGTAALNQVGFMSGTNNSAFVAPKVP